jgi:hypothetical protein
MSKFKVDDQVISNKGSPVIIGHIYKISHNGDCFTLYGESGADWRHESSFDLFKKPFYPKLKAYPNLPHRHVDMICHVANGGIIRDKNDSSVIDHVSQSEWYSDDEYEIVEPKTEDEKLIESIEIEINYLTERINLQAKALAGLRMKITKRVDE